VRDGRAVDVVGELYESSQVETDDERDRHEAQGARDVLLSRQRHDQRQHQHSDQQRHQTHLQQHPHAA